MQRGNKVKPIKRGLSKLLGIKEVQQNIGGYLPYPPEDCEKKEFIKNWDAIPWIDLSICHNCSKIKECQKRKEWIEKLKRKK